MARRYSSEDAKKRILSVCVKMFIEKGYKDSKIADIMSEADVTGSTFHNIFPTKDSVLLCLTEFMFDNQFGVASEFLKGKIDPLMLNGFVLKYFNENDPFEAMNITGDLTLVDSNPNAEHRFSAPYFEYGDLLMILDEEDGFRFLRTKLIEVLDEHTGGRYLK